MTLIPRDTTESQNTVEKKPALKKYHRLVKTRTIEFWIIRNTATLNGEHLMSDVAAEDKERHFIEVSTWLNSEINAGGHVTCDDDIVRPPTDSCRRWGSDVTILAILTYSFMDKMKVMYWQCPRFHKCRSETCFADENNNAQFTIGQLVLRLLLLWDERIIVPRFKIGLISANYQSGRRN